MQLIQNTKDLQAALSSARAAQKSIGLVPTMGALHAGHASLIKRCVSNNDIAVVSVFVNPTQFNDPADLKNYPRTLEADCKLLEDLNVDYVFAPTVSEMYPEEDTRSFSYPPITTVMEGAYRPGHFNGVCQIVSKLFYIVEPTRAYFGEKDFQQIAVIRAMVNDLKIPVEICPCPIIREDSGLAMSSRDALLTEDETITAQNISKTLFKSVEYAKTHTLPETKAYVIDTINAIDGLEVQYYEIVDGTRLESLSDWNDSNYIVGCITVFCGHRPVRLIDNIKYKEPEV